MYIIHRIYVYTHIHDVFMIASIYDHICIYIIRCDNVIWKFLSLVFGGGHLCCCRSSSRNLLRDVTAATGKT